MGEGVQGYVQQEWCEVEMVPSATKNYGELNLDKDTFTTLRLAIYTFRTFVHIVPTALVLPRIVMQDLKFGCACADLGNMRHMLRANPPHKTQPHPYSISLPLPLPPPPPKPEVKDTTMVILLPFFRFVLKIASVSNCSQKDYQFQKKNVSHLRNAF